MNNLFHSTSSSFSKDKENKETSPNSPFSASSTSSVATSKSNSSILKPISINTPLPLKRRQYSSTPQTSQQCSMLVSPSPPCVSAVPQTTDASFLGPSSRKIQNYEQELHFLHDNDEYDFYQLIHNNSLLQLMKNTSCQSCLRNWYGKMHLKKREGSLKLFWFFQAFISYITLGLYCSIEFQCQRSNIIRIKSSDQCSNSQYRGINVRSVIGNYHWLYQ